MTPRINSNGPFVLVREQIRHSGTGALLVHDITFVTNYVPKVYLIYFQTNVYVSRSLESIICTSNLVQQGDTANQSEGLLSVYSPSNLVPHITTQT